MNGVVQSILVGIILVLRINAVYPRSTTSTVHRVWMLGIPIALKLARLANLFAFVHALVTVTGTGAIALKEIAMISSGKPFLKIEWFMELFDNMCVLLCSVLHIRGLTGGIQVRVRPVLLEALERAEHAPHAHLLQRQYVTSPPLTIPPL